MLGSAQLGSTRLTKWVDSDLDMLSLSPAHSKVGPRYFSLDQPVLK